MKNILCQVQEIFNKAISISFNICELASISESPHGDYRCTSAMSIYSKHKDIPAFPCKSTFEIAHMIIKNIPENNLIEKVEASTQIVSAIKKDQEDVKQMNHAKESKELKELNEVKDSDTKEIKPEIVKKQEDIKEPSKKKEKKPKKNKNEENPKEAKIEKVENKASKVNTENDLKGMVDNKCEDNVQQKGLDAIKAIETEKEKVATELNQDKNMTDKAQDADKKKHKKEKEKVVKEEKEKKEKKPKIVDPNQVPCFINIYLKKEYIESELKKLVLQDVIYTQPKKLKILIDFSSPNIAKELHVGHLRSTIIGESCSRLNEFLGHEVLRINHLGDWGTQFGMLIALIFEKFPDFLQNEPKLADLNAFYQEAKKKFDSDEEFKKKSQTNVVKLQSGDPSIKKAWEVLCEISRKSFMVIYKKLNIKIQDMGESFYNPYIPGVIELVKQKQILQNSKGAECIFTKISKTPLMIKKSDGGFGYDSTDMTAIWYRFTQLKCDRLIYITDKGQESHFFLIFEAAKMMGWYNPSLTRCDHMGFGLVLGEGGKKISTRAGASEKLIDLINESIDQAFLTLEERAKAHPDKCFLKTIEEKKDAAEKVGIAAIRYYDLKQNRISNYEFSYEKMLDPKGNTAVYLIYSYARLCSILRKAKVDENNIAGISNSNPFKLTHEAERNLVIKLLRFPEILDYTFADLSLNKICDLLFDIAVKIGEFYDNCKVIGSDEFLTRIQLIYATKKVMEKLFYLLGIDPLSKI